MSSRASFALVFALACSGGEDEDKEKEQAPPDEDQDGVSAEDGDCDDGDASVYPGAPEACDGIDQDCDGTETGAVSVGTTAYASIQSCRPPTSTSIGRAWSSPCQRPRWSRSGSAC